MRTDIKRIAFLTFKQVVSTTWFWIGNILAVAMVIGYENGIYKFFNDGTIEGKMYFFQAFSVIMMFVFFLLYGNSIAQNVVEEKRTKMTESVLYRIKPINLLRAKIIGYLFGAFTQLVLIAATLLLSKPVIGIKVDVNDYKKIILLFATLLLGLTMYLFVFAVFASRIQNINDFSKIIFPGVMMLIVSFILSLIIIKCSTPSICRALMFIPFISPCIAIGCVIQDIPRVITNFELVLYLFLMAAQSAFVSHICTKLYEKALKSEK